TVLFSFVAKSHSGDAATTETFRDENRIRSQKLVSNCQDPDGTSSEASAERFCLLTVSPRHGYIADLSSFQCLNNQDSDLSRSQKKNAEILQSSQGQLC